MSREKVYIVDPVFRGSRMFLSFLLSAKLDEEEFSHEILTRTAFKNDQFAEFFKERANTLSVREFFPVEESKWFYKISWKNCFKLLKHFRRNGNKATYYLTGYNEWFPKLSILLLILTVFGMIPSGIKIVAIEYDPVFLFSAGSRKLKLKKTLQLWLVRSLNIELGVLDERIDMESNPNYFFLPDPPNAFVGLPDRQLNASGHLTLLVVGLQTRRKGLQELFNFLENHREGIPDNIKFRLVGRFSDDTPGLRDKLIQDDTWELREGFLSEEEILEEYSKADYVVLPYLKSFNSSSGVLAYSVYCGTPVISTDHGLIAYRVEKFGLGFTYALDEYRTLMDTLTQISNQSIDDYQTLVKQCKTYSTNNSVREHQRILFEHVS
ncbi:MAG: hypothetical protein Roseis2KO_22100 [Roseivirga sp.]